MARLAGLPEAVIDRAREILRNLEAGEFVGEGVPRLARSRRPEAQPAPSPQLSLFGSGGPDPLRERLECVDVSVLTPLEALNLLDELKKLV